MKVCVCSPVVKGYGLYKQGRDLCISFSPHRFLSHYLFHRWRQIACVCVCLCLTCRTPAQTAVSMARAASCHRKAGLPVLRALLQLVCVLQITLPGYFSVPSRRVSPYIHI